MSFVVLVLLSHSYVGEAKSKHDFRKTNWGMTQEQVKASELNEFTGKKDNALFYSGEINSLEICIVYMFTDNLLTAGSYIIETTHTDKNAYIWDFNNLKKLLLKKYGAPKKEGEQWRNDLYKNDSSEHGFAISLGHLTHYAFWETSETEINMTISGDNYKISLIIGYNSKKYKNKVETKQEETELDKL